MTRHLEALVVIPFVLVVLVAVTVAVSNRRMITAGSVEEVDRVFYSALLRIVLAVCLFTAVAAVVAVVAVTV